MLKYHSSSVKIASGWSPCHTFEADDSVRENTRQEYRDPERLGKIGGGGDCRSREPKDCRLLLVSIENRNSRYG